MSDTATAVRRVIAEATGRELHELCLDTPLLSLGLGEPGVRALVADVEREVDVVLDADDAAEVDTVGRLIRLAQRHRGGLPIRKRSAAQGHPAPRAGRGSP